MNNKTLLFVLLGLGLLYLGSEFIFKKENRSFDPTFLKVDTSRVSQIVFHPQGDEGTFTLNKIGNVWQVQQEDFSASATSNAVQNVLGTIAHLESKRIVGKSQEKWAEYEVEKGATRIEIFDGTKKLGDFLVGRFNFDQQKRKATTFLRKTDDVNIYSIDGFISMTFNQGFDSFRDNTILKLNKGDIQSVFWRSPQQEDALVRSGIDWMVNGEIADSTLTDQYLGKIASIVGSDFTDPEIFNSLGNPDYQLTIEANNQTEPVVISLHLTGNAEKPFTVHSSQNPEAFFMTDSTSVFNKVKLDRGILLGKGEQ